MISLNNTFFIFDAIGLGLFGVVGIEKALTFGFPMWVAIVMGTITGAFGGMIRDILINEVPLIFRKDIYALACVFGGIIYYACLQMGIGPSLTQLIAATGIFVSRIVAVKYHISVPVLKGESLDPAHLYRRNDRYDRKSRNRRVGIVQFPTFEG